MFPDVEEMCKRKKSPPFYASVHLCTLTSMCACTPLGTLGCPTLARTRLFLGFAYTVGQISAIIKASVLPSVQWALIAGLKSLPVRRLHSLEPAGSSPEEGLLCPTAERCHLREQGMEPKAPGPLSRPTPNICEVWAMVQMKVPYNMTRH